MEHPRVHGLSEWRPLARGGRSVVWAARQLSLDRLVAVKVYQRELDEGDRRRFLREAAAARLSDHPGIVTTHDAGILPDDRPYLIMDLCSGGSLTQWLKPENRPSEERVRQVAVRIADALATVHACGVLHRDVKPANILIDSFGNPALADFGLAAGAGAETTAADAACVTSAYAPPEAFGMQPATESGDVFSLAATLYALLAGRPPRNVGRRPRRSRADGRGRQETNWPDTRGQPVLTDTRGQPVLNGRVDDRPEQRPRGSAYRGEIPRPARECAGDQHFETRGACRCWRRYVLRVSTSGFLSFRAFGNFEQPRYCCHGGNSGFAASFWPGGVRRGTTKARKTTRSHSGPGRSLGYCDRTYDGLADQRARSVGSSCHECDARRTVVERRYVTSLRPEAADFDHDTGGRRQHRLRFGGAGDHSVGEFSRLRQALPNRSNPRYVPRWSRRLPAGAALGGRPVAGLPVARQDRPVGPVHRLCRVG